MVSFAEFAALGAALCWSIAGMVSVGPSRLLGALGFNRVRMVMVFLMLAVAALFTDGWSTLGRESWGLLIISGVIGIFAGDTALFATLRRLGPRRAAIMFATSAPMTVALSILVLGDTPAWAALIGCALVIAGVIMAIVFGKRRDQIHQWETVIEPLKLGIAFGLIAALCQSVGIIIAKPILAAGADPIAASALRVGVSALCLIALMTLPQEIFKSKAPLTAPLVGRIAISGFLGMGLGMTLLLFALKEGNAGIVSTLSSTAPVMMLPILWIKTGERPAAGAWIGAALVVGGTAMILNV